MCFSVPNHTVFTCTRCVFLVIFVYCLYMHKDLLRCLCFVPLPQGIQKAIDSAVDRAIELEELRSRERMRRSGDLREAVARHRAATALVEWPDATAEPEQKQLHEYWASDNAAESKRGLELRKDAGSRAAAIGLRAGLLTPATTAPNGHEQRNPTFEAWAAGDSSEASASVEELFQSKYKPPDHAEDAIASGPPVSRSGVFLLTQPPLGKKTPNYTLLKGLGIDIEPRPPILGDVSEPTPVRSVSWSALDAARAAKGLNKTLHTTDAWTAGVLRKRRAQAEAKAVSVAPRFEAIVPRPRHLASVGSRVNTRSGDMIGGVRLEPVHAVLSKAKASQ